MRATSAKLAREGRLRYMAQVKIFIDSADLGEIREAASMGAIDGVTTNPSLLAKSKVSLEQILPPICELVDGPVSAEVLSTRVEGMVEEGRRLAKIHANVVVKIPLTLDGLKAVRTLRGEGISTNVTLCFSPSQALLAAKAGATFISPFVGRLEDQSENGMDLIEKIVTIYQNYSFATEVLVASVRHPVHVVESALMGAHAATLPFSVIQKLAYHPLTDKGLAQFLADAEKIPHRG